MCAELTTPSSCGLREAMMLPIVLNEVITLHTVRPDFGEVLLPRYKAHE